ncbi:conserved exported hypothetical protein [Nostocoides japonicum T1-X7]|uniref:Lipoprotein n=1 Tax=Nostocoides japonicum T1-X7 TaxID=1194083 RepID=A0A077LZE1_9MICO|nr:hypothetical protein [Tetrasphaera japonica]CCH78252.1 conserved exported hypothetical protein [Tetrasphaera japonica T1-X7]
MTKRTVRGLGAALVMSAGVGLSGCAAMSPVQTQESYQPADGVALNLGSIRIDNLLVVAPTKGGPGTVSASVVNDTGQPVAIEFADKTSGATAQFAAPPGVATPVSADSNLVQLASVSAGPGSNITMTVTTATTGTAQVTVPVLATQSFFQTLLPTQAPTTPAPTTTASS